MKLFGLFVCACIFVGVNSGTTFDIDGFSYFISHPMKKNWYQAFRYCIYQGLTLIEINSQEENNRVMSAIARTNLTKGQLPAVWTSGTDLGDKGRYYWAANGHAILYTDYSVGQPDNAGGNEHCLEIRMHLDCKWNDVSCDVERAFICRGNNTNTNIVLDSE